MAVYIGLDGHSKTSTLVSIGEKGQILNQAQVITCEREILEYIRVQKGTKKLIFEESHLSHWFYALLSAEVDELTVCHPGYLGKKQKRCLGQKLLKRLVLAFTGAKTELKNSLERRIDL